MRVARLTSVLSARQNFLVSVVIRPINRRGVNVAAPTSRQARNQVIVAMVIAKGNGERSLIRITRVLIVRHMEQMFKVPDSGGLTSSTHRHRVSAELFTFKRRHRVKGFRRVLTTCLHVPTIQRVRLIIRTSRSQRVKLTRHVTRRTRRLN